MNLQERLERLEPRERRLLKVLVVLFVLFVLVLVPAAVMSSLAASRSENEALRDAIDAVEDGQLIVQKREAKKQQILQRYARPAPALAGFLEKQAKKASIEIPESQDRAVVPHGKDYEERSTKIVLRKVDLSSLVKFMEGIAKSGHPVTVSRLNIRRRGVGTDAYDVQMIVSAFDRKGVEKTAGGLAADDEDEDEAGADSEESEEEDGETEDEGDQQNPEDS